VASPYRCSPLAWRSPPADIGSVLPLRLREKNRAAMSFITATRWGSLNTLPSRRRIRWGWIIFPCTKTRRTAAKRHHRPQRRSPRQRARSSITATRWGFPTPRRCQRKTRWGWIISPSMKARRPTKPARSRSGSPRCKSSACRSLRSNDVHSAARSALSAPCKPTSGASSSSTPNSRAGSKSFTSMRPARRCGVVSR